MFEFIKSLFKRKPANTQSSDPVLVHADIGESIVIKEVALADIKPKTRKPKEIKLKEVKPVEAAANSVKEVKSKTSKAKTVKAAPAKIVQLVPPIPPKKKGRPKKDKIV